VYFPVPKTLNLPLVKWTQSNINRTELESQYSETSVIRTTGFFLLITALTMRQDVVKEQYKRGTQTKISSFLNEQQNKYGLNNTKYVGNLKCF
jgi:hypothetical protein